MRPSGNGCTGGQNLPPSNDFVSTGGEHLRRWPLRLPARAEINFFGAERSKRNLVVHLCWRRQGRCTEDGSRPLDVVVRNYEGRALRLGRRQRLGLEEDSHGQGSFAGYIGTHGAPL